MKKEARLSKKTKTIIEEANAAHWEAWKNEGEQAISGGQAPKLKELLQELGGKISHGDWEYCYYENPLNIIVRTKTNMTQLRIS